MDACSGQASDNQLESAATKTRKSTFCCCGLWRLQGQNIVFLVFVAAIFDSYPQNLSHEACKNARGVLLKTLAKNSSNLSKICPKPSQNPPQTSPKPSPNPPKFKENQSAATKTRKVKKKQATLNDCKALGGHFGRPKPPKRGPRASQKVPKWSPKR